MTLFDAATRASWVTFARRPRAGWGGRGASGAGAVAAGMSVSAIARAEGEQRAIWSDQATRAGACCGLLGSARSSYLASLHRRNLARSGPHCLDAALSAPPESPLAAPCPLPPSPMRTRSAAPSAHAPNLDSSSHGPGILSSLALQLLPAAAAGSRKSGHQHRKSRSRSSSVSQSASLLSTSTSSSSSLLVSADSSDLAPEPAHAPHAQLKQTPVPAGAQLMDPAGNTRIWSAPQRRIGRLSAWRYWYAGVSVGSMLEPVRAPSPWLFWTSTD